jgi:S-DNA-T family DNA segregation ATPase FtsK/SpoIIIE
VSGGTAHHRPARLAPPAVPADDLVVRAPPTGTAGPDRSLWPQLVFPGLTALGGAAFVVSNPQPLFIAFGVTMLVGSIGYITVLAVQQRVGGRRRARHARRRYLAYLEELAERAGETARVQEAAARFVHPGLPELHALACQRLRVWERRPEDPDFATVALGPGTVPLATALRLEESDDPMVESDPTLLAPARRLVAEHGSVHGVPVVVDLRARPSVSLVGPREVTRPLALAMVAELATLCAPQDLAVAICHPPGAAADWELVKWLPHVEPLEELLAAESEQRRLLVVVDGGPLARGELLADLRERDSSVLSLVESRPEEPEVVDLRVEVEPDGSFTVEDGSTGRADRLDPVVCEAIARRLAPLRLDDRDARSALTTTWRLAAMLDVAGPDDLRPERIWRERPEREQLRVPLGVGADGEPLVLDLKEAALDGMGPHGLVVGATGSGKSELLRTLTVGLVVTHPPELLSLVLVDFKGGATFAGMAELPHVAGMITNLQGDLGLVDRMHDALTGEQLRRQELLRRAGNLDSIRAYHRLRAAGADLEPMPFLLVIVDEFGELMVSRPDFVDLFVAIGRVGRSLGMHLLLASQRLEEGRLRGLESHLSYRIALRVFNAAESRTIIGVPDAYTLPSTPGSAYLKTDASDARRFRVASASLPYAVLAAPAPSAGDVTPFTARGLAEPVAVRAAGEAPAGEEAPSTLDLVVGRLRDAAPPAHQVWLPPLEAAVTLDALLAAAEPGRLGVPVGIVDRPRDQARDTLLLDFAGPGGHLAVVGAPQSGKSTLLRTIVASLALTHTAVEAQVYAIDFGGGGLEALARLPHVGTVCGRFDPERARRVVAELCWLIDRRERFFRSAGVESMQAFRALRHTGAGPDEVFGDVFLLIDNWAAVHQELEDLEPGVLDVAARGLGYGVHLVITANRWMEIRSNLRDSIGGRLELRLNEPADSEVDRRLAGLVPAAVPGRGLTGGALFFQTAVPRIDGRPTSEGLHGALEDLVSRTAEAWTGPVAPPARVLPAELPVAALPGPGAASQPGVPIGLAEPALEPVWLDLAGGEPHFLLFGDGESGKTNLCRVLVEGLVARSTPEQAQVVLVDYRRTLMDLVPESFLRAYAPSSPAAAMAVEGLVDVLVARLPDAGVPVARLRERSWWHGPELYVVVDDYDLVVTPGGLNPLMPLVDFLAQGRDLGFHLVLARRAGGAGRALFETVLQRLQDLGTPGLLLSGDRQEGPLLGSQAPSPQPPGRGMLVRGRQPTRLVQVAWSPPRAPQD